MQALAGHPAERTAALPADVSDGAQVTRLVADVVERFGRLEVVVSNAAGYESGPLTELADDAVSSVSGERGDWGQAAYNATKAAVSNFVRSLALTGAPTGCG